jgi:hypothetical protein
MATGRRLYPQQQIRLTDAKGRTYYPSWVEAAGGDEELLGELLDAAESYYGTYAHLTTELLRGIYRNLLQVLRDRGAMGGPVDCETCGERCHPTSLAARYCSNACRQKAYRQRCAALGARPGGIPR